MEMFRNSPQKVCKLVEQGFEPWQSCTSLAQCYAATSQVGIFAISIPKIQMMSLSIRMVRPPLAPRRLRNSVS